MAIDELLLSPQRPLSALFPPGPCRLDLIRPDEMAAVGLVPLDWRRLNKQLTGPPIRVV